MTVPARSSSSKNNSAWTGAGEGVLFTSQQSADTKSEADVIKPALFCRINALHPLNNNRLPVRECIDIMPIGKARSAVISKPPFLPIPLQSLPPPIRQQSGYAGQSSAYPVPFRWENRTTIRHETTFQQLRSDVRKDRCGQTMSQHSYSRQSILQGTPMGTDIDAISQSAHNQQIRIRDRQGMYQLFRHRPAIFCYVARPDNTDNMCTIQVGLPFKIE